MGQYSLRPISLSEFGRHAMLTISGAFLADATPDLRDRAIRNLTTLHGIGLATTKSLRYDTTLTTKEGTNLKGNIRIGPGAFKQDYRWLANVVFHETIHSDQFEFYDQHGVVFAGPAPNSETERQLIALDECEGFYWSWRNSSALSLSADQQNSLRREVRLWMIEIGDEKTAGLAGKGEFDVARLALIDRLAGPTP